MPEWVSSTDGLGRILLPDFAKDSRNQGALQEVCHEEENREQCPVDKLKAFLVKPDWQV